MLMFSSLRVQAAEDLPLVARIQDNHPKIFFTLATECSPRFINSVCRIRCTSSVNIVIFK